MLKIPRVVIAGVHSGAGKTTIVTGLLGALKNCGLKVQSYKIGPDYIDPGYHRLASGRPAHNLDSWLMPADRMAEVFRKTAQGSDIAVIEGVMGLYDGGRGGISSTAAIAKILKAPVILVVDARSMGESAAAAVLGYKMYDPQVNLAGVIVNRLGSATHRDMVAEAISRLSVPVIGSVFRNEALGVRERHLGLTPVTENNAGELVARLSGYIASAVDLQAFLDIANSAPPMDAGAEAAPRGQTAFRLGVAQDEAFSFYYPESLETLVAHGAKLVPFSPLNDAVLPDVDGLVLGGGFPEMFLERLEANITMRHAIAAACRSGMPIYAECGGLMYLCRQIVAFDGKAYDMVNAVPAACVMQHKLETVGYVEAWALADNVLCRRGTNLRGHEFHFSRMIPDKEDNFPWAFEFVRMRTGARHKGGYAAGNVLASYLHMHFAGNEDAAARFAEGCKAYRAYREGRQLKELGGAAWVKLSW